MTIRRKLIALTAGAVGLLVVVAALGALVTTRVAAEGRKSVSASVRSAMVADMMHDAIHNDVYLALNAADEDGLAQARLSLAQHEDTLRASLADAARTGRSEAVREAVLALAPAIDRYLAAADELVALAGTDPDAAAQRLGAFTELAAELERDIPTVSDAIDDSEAQLHEQARAAQASGLRLAIALTLVAVGLLGALAVSIARSITRPLREILTVVAQVGEADRAGVPLARVGADADGELGILGQAVDQMLDALSRQQVALQQDAARSAFGQELGAALEMVDTEVEIYRVCQRAMALAAAESRVELLLADSSQAHLEQAAVHPASGGPGCGVASPYGCAAVRRGSTVVFRSSDALDACPKLVDRPGGPLTAVCAPVGFMGKALGVLHATQPEAVGFAPEHVERLSTLASGLGTRIGTIRAFERTQMQASTDGLTGLMNRRSMEERLGLLFEREQRFAMAVADLDHFKSLNDTYGHEMGDRALGQFAEVLRTATRVDDLVARWGGEEFTIVFPGLAAREAEVICERVREHLALACVAANLPSFTVSFGLVDSLAGTDTAELFRLADQALYAAKDAGRNRTVVGPVGATGPSADERHAVDQPSAMRPLQ